MKRSWMMDKQKKRGRPKKSTDNTTTSNIQSENPTFAAGISSSKPCHGVCYWCSESRCGLNRGHNFTCICNACLNIGIDVQGPVTDANLLMAVNGICFPNRPALEEYVYAKTMAMNGLLMKDFSFGD